ncbi:MAG: GNAT family N-acetyltransferase [Ignavibacteriaceae bacterium]|nr:GNAT family N-acetyltransferase [Ignavibacteriaceae bacterium]
MLKIIPVTAETAKFELEKNPGFGEAIGAEVPANWPPEILADALGYFYNLLRENPQNTGWYGWYAIDESSGKPVLAGSIGFFGPPDENGIVETGYSVLPQFQNRGLASEMIRQLTNHAFSTGKVRFIEAETDHDNTASQKVLIRNGFRLISANNEKYRYRLEKADPHN